MIFRISAAAAFWLLRRFLKDNSDYGISGDFEELYNYKLSGRGPFRANIWLYLQVVKNIPLMFSSELSRSYEMFKNYIKIAIRNIQRRKVYSSINILGLSIGLACSILILLWVQNELNYDKFHSNYDNIYRVAFEEQLATSIDRGYSTPAPMGPAMMEEIPGIDIATRYYERDAVISIEGDEKEYNESLGFADPQFSSVFTLDFISGVSETCLNEENSAIISESMAVRLFGGEDPAGRTIIVNGSFSLKITGVIRDLPDNSTLDFDVLVNFARIAEYFGRPNILTNWNSFGFATFFLLNESSSIKDVDSKIIDFYDTHVGVETSFQFFSVPLSRLHLHSLYGGGPIIYVYMFAVIAAFILTIACINFMNLTTAQSINRAREVGIRKVVGSGKGDLIVQFFSESAVLVLVSFMIAVGSVILLLPYFSMLTGKTFTPAYFGKTQILTGLACLAILTAFISGIYPSFVISSFRPVNIFKGGGKASYWSGGLRKALVVFQFAISVALIISTISVLKQVDFFKNKGLGFDRQNKVYFRSNSVIAGRYEVLREEFLKSPLIENVSISSFLPGTGSTASASGITWEGNTENKTVLFHIASVDHDFASTFNIEMAEGRFFSEDHSSDINNYIINEEAARQMGLESPVGKSISARTEGEIIGVIRDFNLKSLHSEVVPMLFMINPQNYRYVVADIAGDTAAEATDHLRSVFEKLLPGYPLNYTFLEDNIGTQYHSEEKLAEIYKYFASMAILISCLGLLGLSTFMAKQRTKEIGVRKVLGAASSSIVVMFSKDFLKLVLIANIIALPAGTYFMNKWLQNFAYRINIGLDILAVSAVSVMVIALLTVSYNAVRSALADPVNSLRSE